MLIVKQFFTPVQKFQNLPVKKVKNTEKYAREKQILPLQKWKKGNKRLSFLKPKKTLAIDICFGWHTRTAK